MKSISEIVRAKQLLKLPTKRDQLEYWGPVNHPFADSFLTMGHSFIYNSFPSISSKRLKEIFSSFVEMVQNVSEYNEEEFKNNYPQSYIRLKGEEGMVIIDTINCIKDENLLSVSTIFEKVSSFNKEELREEFKRKLMSGDSLGLIMLRKLSNSTFEYHITKDEAEVNWLSIELRINYENT